MSDERLDLIWADIRRGRTGYRKATADAIDSLQADLAERDSLREALEWLANCNPDINDVNSIARRALTSSEKESE